MGGRRPSGSLALAGICLLTLLTGCEARLDVQVAARPDGSGEVRATVILDDEAAAQVPDLDKQLRAEDLEAAGWRVEGPSRRDDGGTRVEAVKSFRSPAGATRAVQELSGAQGPFRDFNLTVDRSYLDTRTALTGTVDLSRGLDGFSDEVLVRRLGSPLGVDPATIERHLGKPLAEAVTFRVEARLPGEEPRVWTPRLGQRLDVAAATRRWNVERIVFTGVALVAGIALAATLVRRLFSSR